MTIQAMIPPGLRMSAITLVVAFPLLADHDANAVDLARRVDALEVMDRSAIAQPTFSAVDHEAAAVGAAGGGVGQSIRAVRAISLDLVAASQGEVEVARWVADDLEIRCIDVHRFYYGLCAQAW